MTLRHDIRHRRGDSFASKSYAVLINGASVPDLESWTIKAQVRREDDSLIHEWTGDQVIVGTVTLDRDGIEVETDIIRLETAGADTDAWPIAVGAWELQISKGAAVYTLVDGSFRIVRDVTR